MSSFYFEKTSRRASQQEVTGDQVSHAKAEGIFKEASLRAALPISKKLPLEDPEGVA